ncbi:uncharacterized protein LOC135930913 [Gordionus sp. m RMFG-2023]|uniref:uncharacterized protein LOC135930913 n=1 Tax=Gordionus sp. m RMFG-2023 TaxID=3053472 RepID=UPI0031FCE1CB
MRSLSSLKYCSVYGKNEVEMMLDYFKVLIEEIEESNLPYFNFKFITRYTHSDMQGLGVLDDLLYEYFEGLIQNGRLKNTFIFLFGDHGLRYGPPRQTLDGMLENRMPFLLAIPPDNFFTDFDQNDTIFRTNTQRLVTAFDIHKTLLNLLEITNGARDTTKGISLLEPIPMNRTCESAFISADYCPCNWIKMVPPKVFNKIISGNDIDALYTSKLIRYGVDLAIKSIKNILSSYRHICLVDELELATIIYAILITNNNVTSDQDLKMLAALNINTNVNDAVKISDIDETRLPKVFGLIKGFVLAFKFSPNQVAYETTIEFYQQNATKIFKKIKVIFPLDAYEVRSYCTKVNRIKPF